MRLMGLFGSKSQAKGSLVESIILQAQPIPVERELPEPTEIAREFEQACSGNLPKAIQMLRAADGNPAVVGMRDTTGGGFSSKGRPDAVLLAQLEKFNDEDFCVAFSALARTFEKAVPSRKLTLCKHLVDRPEVRCELVEQNLRLVHEAWGSLQMVQMDKDKKPAVNLVNHFVSARLTESDSKETLQQACDFLVSLKAAGLEIFPDVRTELSTTRHTLMVDAFAVVHGKAFIQDTRDDLGNGLLHRACLRRDNPEVVERLVVLGCDPLLKNTAGETPLVMSAKLDNEAAVGALLRAHRYEEDALTQAIERRPSGMVRALLEADRARIYVESVIAQPKASLAKVHR
jgi:Ankyrin repeats (3 copies)